MTLFLSLLFFAHAGAIPATHASPVGEMAFVATAVLPYSPMQPPAATSKVMKEVVTTQEVTVESAPLTTDGDNTPILAAFLDSLPASSKVTLPAGLWHLHSTLQVKKTVELAADSPQQPATLRLIAANANADVVKVSEPAPAPVYEKYVDGCVFRNIVFDVAGQKETGIYNCLDVFGGGLRCYNCTFMNSPHEGVVSHGGYPGERPGDLSAELEDCIAINCGYGNQSYGLSTAGLNCHSNPTHYRRCKTRQCQQGAEVDGHGSTVTDCVFEDPNPNGVGPQMGVNVGSTGKGISKITISRNTIKGYGTAIGFGNGIGRLADIVVTNNVIYDGEISAMGGDRNNRVATDPVSPDTGQSHVDHNVMIISDPNKGVFHYNTGPSVEEGNTFGKEPCTFNNNVVVYIGQSPRTAFLFGVSGKTEARITFNNNLIFGVDEAPALNDVRLQSNNANTMIKPPTHITWSGNLAFKRDGSTRPVSVYVEP